MRTCYNCANSKLCKIRADIDRAVMFNSIFLNIDGDAAPESFTEIFTALARCCMEFVERKQDNAV